MADDDKDTKLPELVLREDVPAHKDTSSKISEEDSESELVVKGKPTLTEQQKTKAATDKAIADAEYERANGPKVTLGNQKKPPETPETSDTAGNKALKGTNFDGQKPQGDQDETKINCIDLGEALRLFLKGLIAGEHGTEALPRAGGVLVKATGEGAVTWAGGHMGLSSCKDSEGNKIGFKGGFRNSLKKSVASMKEDNHNFWILGPNVPKSKAYEKMALSLENAMEFHSAPGKSIWSKFRGVLGQSWKVDFEAQAKKEEDIGREEDIEKVTKLSEDEEKTASDKPDADAPSPDLVVDPDPGLPSLYAGALTGPDGPGAALLELSENGTGDPNSPMLPTMEANFAKRPSFGILVGEELKPEPEPKPDSAPSPFPAPP